MPVTLPPQSALAYIKSRAASAHLFSPSPSHQVRKTTFPSPLREEGFPFLAFLSFFFPPSLPFFFFLKITTGVKKIMPSLLTLLNFGTRYPLFSFFLLDCSYFDVHFNINMVFVLFLLLLALQLLVLDLLHFMERYEDGDKCLMRFQCFGLPYFSYGLVRRTPWHHQLHSRVGACHWVCCCLSLVH